MAYVFEREYDNTFTFFIDANTSIDITAPNEHLAVQKFQTMFGEMMLRYSIAFMSKELQKYYDQRTKKHESDK